MRASVGLPIYMIKYICDNKNCNKEYITELTVQLRGFSPKGSSGILIPGAYKQYSFCTPACFLAWTIDSMVYFEAGKFANKTLARYKEEGKTGKDFAKILIEAVDNYFATVTDEQLIEDLRKASEGYQNSVEGA